MLFRGNGKSNASVREVRINSQGMPRRGSRVGSGVFASGRTGRAVHVLFMSVTPPNFWSLRSRNLGVTRHYSHGGNHATGVMGGELGRPSKVALHHGGFDGHPTPTSLASEGVTGEALLGTSLAQGCCSAVELSASRVRWSGVCVVWSCACAVCSVV